MQTVPSRFVSMITFPGVVVHEMAHRFFCDVCGVPVLKVSYFREGDPVGYVQHGEINSLPAAILVSIGPLIINTILCMALTLPFVLPVFVLHTPQNNPAIWLLGWLGLSIGIHAFPSGPDVNNLRNHILKNHQSKTTHALAYIILTPLRFLSMIGGYLWFCFLYAVVISLIIPALM